MVTVLDPTSWKASPPERLPGEILEEYIIRRGTRMRKLQAQLAVYVEEFEALDDGPEAERLLDSGFARARRASRRGARAF